MIKTMGDHNLRAAVTLLVLVVFLLALVVAVEPSVTAFSSAHDKVTPTDEHGSARTGIVKDPYIEHHAAIVARWHDGRLH